MPRFVWMIALVIAANTVCSAAVTNVAQVRMFGLSVRVGPGTATQLGPQYRLTFSSHDFAAPNHEVYPILEEPYSHFTAFLFEAPDFPEPLAGELVIDLPDDEDSDENGIPDFHEVSRGVAAQSGGGVWQSPITGGELVAVWNRAPGEHRGTVVIQLVSDDFGALPEFTHSFEIIEYAGTLTYEPGTSQVRATLRVERAGDGTSILAGPLELTRDPEFPLDVLLIGESTLTNALGQLVPVSIGEMGRDPGAGGLYFGGLALEDGDPATPEIDYELFNLVVTDPNDADGDGIPDLTDEPGDSPPPGRPTLSIAVRGDEVELTVEGDPGVTFILESTDRISGGEWTSEFEIALEGPSAAVSIPRPQGGPRFWRLRWP